MNHSLFASSSIRRLVAVTCAAMANVGVLGAPVAAAPSVVTASPPTVSGVETPSNFPAHTGGFAGGDIVTIRGRGFTGATQVRFGSKVLTPAWFTIISDAQILLYSPAGPRGTTVHVTVSKSTGSSAVSPADRYTFATATEAYLSAPVPGPFASSGGTRFEINGSGFSGMERVELYSGNCPTTIPRGSSSPGTCVWSIEPPYISVVSDTRIVGYTPPLPVPGIGGFAVASSSLNLRAQAFAPINVDGPTPTVKSVTPTEGPKGGGTVVKITGTDLLGVSEVHFGARTLSAQPASTCDVTTNSCPYNFYGTPSNETIYAYAPDGPAGTTVDITLTSLAGTSPISPADRYTWQ